MIIRKLLNKFVYPFEKKLNIKTHTQMQETTFYEQLQNCQELDLRDPRGKVHNVAFILLGLTIGLLRNRDGCLSSMKNKNIELCNFYLLDFGQTYPIQ